MDFQDRTHAGRLLARRLLPYAGRQDVVVLGLPPGGVVVAAEVADALQVPLDVLVVRKPGVPESEEPDLDREQREIARRERLYRGEERARTISGHIAVVVDDGMATGATMEAGVAAVRRLQPGWLVVAVPVAPHGVCARIGHQVDELVCLLEPPDFEAVGDHYAWFEPLDDAEVRVLLHSACVRQSA